MDWIRRSLNFEGLFVVEPQGRSGGLALLWKEADHANLIGYSQNHIDVETKVEGMNAWRLTGLYGELDRAQRRKTWDLLRYLARDSNLPWCVIGDTNNVTSQADKIGGAPYPEWLVEGFTDTITEIGLIDMDLEGHQFTWERGRGTEDWMEVRLDRALTSQSWLDLSPLAKLLNLEGSPSDHSPILLVTNRTTQEQGIRRFRFENAWLTEPMCKQLIMDGWSSTNLSVQQKIKVCGEKLAVWGKEITGNFGGRIRECKQELKMLRNQRDAQSQVRYKEVKIKLRLILEQREIFWRQRSKQLWLQSGEQNSKYFHASASTRRRTNRIHKLKNPEGQWCDWENGLDTLISNYFAELFSSSNSEWAEVIACIPITVTTDQNAELLKPISAEEVRRALFQMHPDKSPGPDGMTPAFFPKTLDDCGSRGG